jgi:SPP1 family phage portal protein
MEADEAHFDLPIGVVKLIDGKFGRKVIYTSATEIDESNVVKVLNKARQIHFWNEKNIDYLENYYTGNQPILRRIKEVRPEINNKIVENHAFEIVEFMTAQNFGEPIQYANRNTENSKSSEIDKLNAYMFSEDKGELDIQIGRWQNICGTAYRFIFNDANANIAMDECPFGLDVLRPQDAFVIYSTRAGRKPMMGVWRTVDEDGAYRYNCYTEKQYFEVKGGQVVKTGVNGITLIPIIEYPKNDHRIGAIEVVLPLLDSINNVQSNRMDGIEQFVQAFMKFVNCQIDKDTFLEMCKLGAIQVTGDVGLPADVDSISKELNQTEVQVAKDDLYNNVLIVEGMPDRKSENSGGDTDHLCQ